MGIPSPSISWNKVGGVLSENSRVKDDGTLAFQKIQKVDEGTYECVAENPAGKTEAKVIVFVRGNSYLI